jgi:hypothetical protein
VTTDRTTTNDTGAETVEEPPAPEHRPPPDTPGTDGGPSRADSRAAAAAANEKPDTGSQRPERSNDAQNDAAKDTSEPATATESTGEVTDDSDLSPEKAATSAEVAEAGQSSADSPDVNEESGHDPLADLETVDGNNAGTPDTDEQVADEPQDVPLSPRDAQPAVIDESPEKEGKPAADPPEVPISARVAKDQTPWPEGSDERSNAVPRTGERESHESAPVASREQGASPRADGHAAPDKAVVTDDGGWEWKGLALTPEENAVADSAIEARRAAEGRDSNGEYGEQGLTPQIRGVEHDLPYGELVPDTEKYAVKGDDRFKEKLAKKIALEPDKPTAELAAEIHDGVRYTFTFPGEKYTDGVYDAEGKLRRRGYELQRRKPSWGDSDYKGVNSRWGDPSSGVLFEVQFHTPESWEAKQKTHDAYATIENPDSTPAEKAAARRYQQEVSAAIPVPEGADEIPPYTDEGH